MNTSISKAIETALEHHQAGHLRQAEAIYRQILQAEPNHPDALHLLGVIAHQAGRNEIAVELINKAIRVNPGFADSVRKLLELAKAEARALLDGSREEAAPGEMRMAVQYLKTHWNRRYGLVEVG